MSPKKPTSTAGSGALVPWSCCRRLPTARLGSGKWGLGPTFVVLKQEGPFTYGMLANHIWSVAGDSDRAYVSSTFMQPFFSYITKTKTTFTINTESTYDWRARQLVGAHQLLGRAAAEGRLRRSCRSRLAPDTGRLAPASGPEGWGWRAVVTLLFPK